MTWIHFKSAVTHPGLAPGLSATSCSAAGPTAPLPQARPGAGACRRCLLALLIGAGAVAARSPHHASLARSPMGPCRLFPAADEVALGAGAMFPRQPWHAQPRTSSPCHSLGPGVGPGTGHGSVPAATAPEHITGSGSLLPAPTPRGPGEKCTSRVSRTTPMQEPRKTGTAAGAGHRHHPSPRGFVALT